MNYSVSWSLPLIMILLLMVITADPGPGDSSLSCNVWCRAGLSLAGCPQPRPLIGWRHVAWCLADLIPSDVNDRVGWDGHADTWHADTHRHTPHTHNQWSVNWIMRRERGGENQSELREAECGPIRDKVHPFNYLRWSKALYGFRRGQVQVH